jgi:uncharacterized membrane protein YedE/YeeE
MDIQTGVLVALIGFAGGIGLGLAARIGRFCTLGAIEDAIFSGDLNRLRSWVLAMAVAIAGTWALDAGGIIDMTRSFYLSDHINLPSLIGGGLVFGIGMALVGTCGYGALARAGGGDLKSLVIVVVIGISAYMASGGITAFARINWFEPLAIPLPAQQSLPALGTAVTGLPLESVIPAAIIAGLLYWCFKDAAFRNAPRPVLAGLAVGAMIVLGWFATGHIGSDPFDEQRLMSFTFVRPLGDTLVYLMTFTGASINFGIGATLGVIAGAAIGSLAKREFRWEACDDAPELRRQIFGGFLMGTGGLLSLGCTVGQGLSAVSVLALSAPIVLASIFIGAWLGLTYLVEGSVAAAIGHLIGRRAED